MFPGLIDLLDQSKLQRFYSEAEQLEYNNRARDLVCAHTEQKHVYLRSINHWGISNESN